MLLISTSCMYTCMSGRKLYLTCLCVYIYHACLTKKWNGCILSGLWNFSMSTEEQTRNKHVHMRVVWFLLALQMVALFSNASSLFDSEIEVCTLLVKEQLCVSFFMCFFCRVLISGHYSENY